MLFLFNQLHTALHWHSDKASTDEKLPELAQGNLAQSSNRSILLIGRGTSQVSHTYVAAHNLTHHNLVEAHCYGIRKGLGHVLSNHVAVNG